MFFTISLYIALSICVAGTIFKIINWFKFKMGQDFSVLPLSHRASYALKGFLKAIVSPKIFGYIKVLVADIILQLGILKAGFSRWLMHMLIFYGFLMLLFMHAMEKLITAKIFGTDLAYTNPFLFLREIFGLMVIAGLLIAVVRRFSLRTSGLNTNQKDTFAIVIIVIIIFSGILLEGLNMASYSEFKNMVEMYNVNEEDKNSLETYWVKNFGTVSSTVKEPFDPKVLELGKNAHNSYCASCHAPNSTAFIGYGIAKVSSPFSLYLDKLQIANNSIFWYIHILSCFIGLAYLPFGKFFHIFSTPLSLIAKATIDEKEYENANKVTKRIMGLDACTHCCECSMHCSVAPAFKVIPNINILPSEKISAIKKLTSNKKISDNEITSISEGSFICTNCYRCTTKCPSGINLQDIWTASKTDLTQIGYPAIYDKVMQKQTWEWSEIIKKLDPVKINESVHKYIEHSDKLETLYACVQCSTCTSVCPVVAFSEYPSPDLDFTPQQVMNLLRLKLVDLALGSRMVWNCTTCYMCQENCPEGIKIADIMYELRNLAYAQFNKQMHERRS